MTLIEVVILAGAQCLSPISAAESTTEISKVPCAVLIRLDQETGNVEFTPPAAATDPQVIAMLVKPGEVEDLSADAMDNAGAEGDGQDAIPPPKPEPREVQEPPPKPKKIADRTSSAEKTAARKTASATKKKRIAKRKDSCGSYKAVWYTNKEGRRKYRCVRTG